MTSILTHAPRPTGLGWPQRIRPSGTGLGWPAAPTGRSSGPAPAEPRRPTTTTAAAAVDPRPDSRETGEAGAGTRSGKEPHRTGRARAVTPVRAVPRETAARPGGTRILTVANQKGGVGKTTTAVNLGAALSTQGCNVLVVDMDPQGNASTALGVDHRAGVAGIYDVVMDGRPLGEVIQRSAVLPTLHCAPATIDLAGAEIELVPLVARESRLRRALEGLLTEQPEQERYDYVLLDCPPSLGLLTVNAFVAAREVLIPIQCEYYALEGLSQLLTNIELIREHLNPQLHVSHILLTMYDGRTRLAAQVADEVRAHFPGLVLRTSVPRSVRISEAPSHGETVITYDPTSTGALCYLDAAAEIAATVGTAGRDHATPARSHA